VDNDVLRKQWCDVLLVSEKDAPAWKARLDKQFALQPATMKRILTWCDYYRVDPLMRSEFFAEQSKPLIAGMKSDEKMSLMNSLRHPLGMHDEAQSVMRSVRTESLRDEELVRYGSFVGNYEPEETVLRYFTRIKGKAMGAKARFDYYNQRSHRNPPNMEKALTEIVILLKDPKYAAGLVMRRANFQQNLARFEEAIKSYRSANEQPASTWGETDCLVALKQYGKAVQVVLQLESVGGQHASQAGLKIADIYKISGDKGKEVTQLRLVLKRYPKSSQSSEAHNRLESYGVALIGGESEAEE
jgi:tetratricopeptide (TPR) repeat protein